LKAGYITFQQLKAGYITFQQLKAGYITFQQLKPRTVYPGTPLQPAPISVSAETS